MADLDFVVGSTNLELVVGETADDFNVGATSDKHYSEAFTNQSTVVVEHNLGKYPATQIFDSAGDQVEGTIRHDSLNQLTATFVSSFTGTIICN